nr:hypothetical protein [Aggregatibacter actinomycetemcomitans]
MAEQQETKDWLDKLIAFFKNPNKDLAYSIRKRGEDEIEIRNSIFDGYARGFIRFILFAGFLIVGFGRGNNLTDPFGSQISDFRQDYTWAITPDELIIPNYKDYLELYKKRIHLLQKNHLKHMKNIDNLIYVNGKMIGLNLSCIVFGYVFSLLLCYSLSSSRAPAVSVSTAKNG